jgi:hypothetical protein
LLQLPILLLILHLLLLLNVEHKIRHITRLNLLLLLLQDLLLYCSRTTKKTF